MSIITVCERREARGLDAHVPLIQRDDAPTAPVLFETPAGIGCAEGNGPAGTLGLFPQTSANLSVRWCSPALKIDVLAASIRNQPRFLDGGTLVVTGERAEESPARAGYPAIEPHRPSTLARRDPFTPGVRATSGRSSSVRASVLIRPMTWGGDGSLAGPASSARRINGPRSASFFRAHSKASQPAKVAAAEPFTVRWPWRSLRIAALLTPSALPHLDELARAA